MPALDATATAQLDSGDPTKPVFLIYLDIDGDPIRATTTSYPIAVPSVSDPDLSGQTFYATSALLEVGDIQYSDNGSETLAITLSGLLLPDADLLNAIGDRTKWQGRSCRLWVIIRNEGRVQQGAIADFYTGYMSAATILPGPDQQAIRLEVEGYKALLNGASNRSYLDQGRFDASDTSASATISSGNNAKAAGTDLTGDPTVGGVFGRAFQLRGYD